MNDRLRALIRAGMHDPVNMFVAYCVPTKVWRVYKKARYPRHTWARRKHLKWAESLERGSLILIHGEKQHAIMSINRETMHAKVKVYERGAHPDTWLSSDRPPTSYVHDVTVDLLCCADPVVCPGCRVENCPDRHPHECRLVSCPVHGCFCRGQPGDEWTCPSHGVAHDKHQDWCRILDIGGPCDCK